jgi:hypothetical protein
MSCERKFSTASNHPAPSPSGSTYQQEGAVHDKRDRSTEAQNP